MTLPLSPDERRVVEFLGRIAAAYEQAARDKPFSFNGVRAKVVRRLEAAIAGGSHR